MLHAWRYIQTEYVVPHERILHHGLLYYVISLCILLRYSLLGLLMLRSCAFFVVFIEVLFCVPLYCISLEYTLYASVHFKGNIRKGWLLFHMPS